VERKASRYFGEPLLGAERRDVIMADLVANDPHLQGLLGRI